MNIWIHRNHLMTCEDQIACYKIERDGCAKVDTEFESPISNKVYVYVSTKHLKDPERISLACYRDEYIADKLLDGKYAKVDVSHLATDMIGFSKSPAGRWHEEEYD